MICRICDGEVLWVGPLSDLTHAECRTCGAVNSQVDEIEMEIEMETELRVCPFCGSREIESGEALIEREGNFYSQAGCRDCGALGPVRPADMDSASERNTNSDNAWNMRFFD
ncbi:MAG: Lar family restriction alleviation protein [Agarilytica sp.]